MPLIYIVEDDANIREIEQFSLESAGYSTRAFTCAKDFYAALLEKAPSLCLLDVMLPDEDGLTIVKKLRAGAATKHLPVLRQLPQPMQPATGLAPIHRNSVSIPSCSRMPATSFSAV